MQWFHAVFNLQVNAQSGHHAKVWKFTGHPNREAINLVFDLRQVTLAPVWTHNRQSSKLSLEGCEVRKWCIGSLSWNKIVHNNHPPPPQKKKLKHNLIPHFDTAISFFLTCTSYVKLPEPTPPSIILSSQLHYMAGFPGLAGGSL